MKLNNLNEQILKSMNEFDQNLTSNENKQEVDIFQNKFLQFLFSLKL